MTPPPNSNQPTPSLKRPSGGGLLGNLLVALFLFVTFGLGIRGLTADESRFGWGMFGRQCEYLVIASWVYPDGSLQTHVPGDELHGRSNFLRQHPSGRATRLTRQALGTVRRWCVGYGEYLCENLLPKGAIGVQIEFTYAIGQPLHGARDFTTEDLYIPAATETEPPQ